MSEKQQTQAVTAMQEFRHYLEGSMKQQIAAVLPAHVPVDRFVRIVLTAVQTTPDLLLADRSSVWNACLRCAQDGLLPDGREAALVIYKMKDKRTNEWFPVATYIPMIAGVLKKVRNSGELRTITAHVVYEKDVFKVVYGDTESIEHTPFLDGDRGKVRGAYAIATLRDGDLQREYMPLAEIEKVQACSKAETGPWKYWWDEMARKTVLRRLSKRLPMSTDLEELMHRDDELYDLNKLDKVEGGKTISGEAQGSGSKLDTFAQQHGAKQLTDERGATIDMNQSQRTQDVEERRPVEVVQVEGNGQKTTASTVRGSVQRSTAPASAGKVIAQQQEPDDGGWKQRLHELKVALSCCLSPVAIQSVTDRFQSKLEGAPAGVLHEAQQLIDGRNYELEHKAKSSGGGK